MKHFLLLCALLLSFPAAAQTYNAASGDRIDRLERDLQLLQRQLARGGRNGSTVAVNPTSLPEGPAQIEVRLSAMDEEIRALRGKLEESEFQVKKLTEQLEKMQKDTEFRFSELSPQKQSDETAGAAPAPPRKPINDAATPMPAPKSFEEAPRDDTPPKTTTAGDGVLRMPDQKTTETSTPRDLYNYAFRLLNQTKYEESASAFESFTKQYPKDPLVGNAYYWLGETYYIRRDYVAAADSFRQGFEILPNGPKAADNLLKLAMSLNALGRDNESCIVLKQITTKFKKSSTSISNKAEQEQKRMGCK